MAEPFWDWAVAVYGRGSVAEACLRLQDEGGHNVPLLLWAAWAGVHGVRIGDDLASQAAAIARVWSDEVIVPLRKVRRRMKAALHDGDDRDRMTVRNLVKATELEAEKALMAQLTELVVPGALLPPGDQATAISEALRPVAGAWSPDRDDKALVQLSQALTKG
ncbi:TIGR02444 family protein [Asticcacaulis sp. AC402]|uniref:TIGR02444 family protein n=1 Tax=Asticcacaulis sp. AC402 TaxID=1282361 RepID=UPI0003C409FD|nr:TIGR02444 family protein [Asticcacaulis sp. AC402]ESQ74982.1 hypothetical protein ABAC402_11300 [Asticcacaulis sp. AC402]